MQDPTSPSQEQSILLHQELQVHMQKEVYLMRELLSNMHQEEVSLMLHDMGSLHQILEQRTYLIEKLGTLRSSKQETLKQLQHPNPYVSLPLEIASLFEQLSILTDKIHRQTMTNQRLNAHPEYYAHILYPQKLSQRCTKKLRVATLQVKK